MNQELIAYFQKIVNLEKAVFENQQLIDGYTQKVDEGRPEKPVLTLLPTCQVGVEPDLEMYKKDGLGLKVLIPVALLTIALYFFSLKGAIALTVLLIILSVVIILFDKKIATNAWLASKGKYDALVQQDKATREENARRTTVYKEETQTYSVKTKEYNTHYSVRTNQLKNLQTQLEKQLDACYNQGIIYSKYRNFVAVATMLEYLESGRCEQLDGPNGAYNLYEMEIRQNVVIAQLSQIVENLSGIQNSQYLLWEKISESQEEIASLLVDIKDDTKIGNYYNQVVAETLKNSIIAT